MTISNPPSGSRETYEDPRSGLTLEGVTRYAAFLHDTTVAVVEELRRFFQTSPHVREADYRWRGTVRENGEIETSLDSKIHISSEHPDQATRWPSVLVHEVTCNIRDLWLGKKMGTLYAPNPNYSAFGASQAEISGDNYDEQPDVEVGERWGGKMDMRVVLAITATGSGARTECNKVADLVLHGLKLPIQRELGRRGFDYMPDQGSVGGETPTAYQGMERNKNFARALTFGLQTEWYDDYFYIAEIVQEIDLKRVYVVGLDPREP